MTEQEFGELAALEQHDALLEEPFQDVPTLAGEVAWNTGQRLLQVFHQELTAAGVKITDDYAPALRRVERMIKLEVLAGFQRIITGGEKAAEATLAKVVFAGDKIEASLEVDRHTQERHQLADFAGRQVLIVLADDLDEHLEGLGDLIADLSDVQIDLEFSPPLPPRPDADGQA